MANKGWTIRDADYDVDKAGYGLIRLKTILYHATLLSKSKSQAKGADPTPDEVERAEAEINQEIYHKLRQRELLGRGRLPSLRDLAIALGSGLIGVFLGKLIEIMVTTGNIGSLHWLYWLCLVIGVVCFVPYLRAET